MVKWYLAKLTEQDIFTILCTFAAIGIIGLIYDLCLLIKRKIFGEKYLSTYEQWIHNRYEQRVHNRSSDGESYEPLLRWLQRNSTRIDNEMGPPRHIDFYNRSPSENQAILNRHIGELENLISKKVCELFINPLAWLTRAVRFVFDVFLWSLRSVGLISVNRENRLRNHSSFEIIIGTITVLGTLFSVIAGWDSVIEFFRRIFGWLDFISIN